MGPNDIGITVLFICLHEKVHELLLFFRFKKKFQWFADLLFTLHSLIWHIGTKFYILSLRFRPQNLLQIPLVLIYTSKEKTHSLWCYFSVHTEQTLPQEVTLRKNDLTRIREDPFVNCYCNWLVCFFIFVFRICTEHSNTGPATNSDSSREWFNHCVFHN